MRNKAVSILRGVLLLVMLLKLPVLFDFSSKDFLLSYTAETSETETESTEEDGGEEDEFVRLATQWSCHHLISSATHESPTTANQDAHIREIVPPPPQG